MKHKQQRQTLQPRLNGPSKGFTILELMIATALSVVVLSGVLSVFANTQKSELLNRAVTKLEENGRLALNVISKDIRMSGYQGCTDLSKLKPPAFSGSGAGNVAINNLQLDKLRGWEAPPSHLSALGITPLTHSDSVQVLRASNDKALLSQPQYHRADPLIIPNGQLSVSTNDFLIVSNCEYSDIIAVDSVTSDPTQQTITYQSANGSELSTEYSNDSSALLKLQTHLYFVANTGKQDRHDNPIFSLYRYQMSQNSVEEIVEGVENIQLLYGQIDSTTGNAHFFNANQVTDWGAVNAVKIALLISSAPVLDEEDTHVYHLAGQSIQPVTLTSNNNPGAGEYASNNRLRRSMNMTIPIRNRVN